MKIQLYKIQNGNAQELEIFIFEAYPKIYSYLFRKLGNETIAKDLTQETFLRFMKKLETLPQNINALHYLYRISHNLCNDHYRVCYREVEEIDIPDKRSLPIDTLLQEEKKEQIKKAIYKLGEEQKDVILLKYYQNLKIKEIAKILNEKESTVKTRLRLGTRKLKQLLKGGELDDF